MGSHQLLNLLIILHVYWIHILMAELDNTDGVIKLFQCKSCGQEVFSSNDLIYMKSPFAVRTWNDTLTEHSSLLPEINNSRLFATVQLLRNPHGSSFEVITTRRSNLLLLNDTKSIQDTWFPNFMWIIGVCPNCLAHLGWYFESVVGEDGFFALILDKLVDDDFASSLVITPKLKMF